MRRHVLPACAVLSLLLCAATVWAWVRSYSVAEWVGWERAIPSRVGPVARQPDIEQIGLFASNGAVGFGYGAGGKPPLYDGRPRTFHRHPVSGYKLRNVRLLLPCWLAVLLTGALPAWWLVRHTPRERRRRRIAAGLCWRCGYDVRATPDRCPECGATLPKRAGAGTFASLRL